MTTIGSRESVSAIENAILFAALIYWVFSFFMSRYSQYLERRLETGHRR